MWRKSESLGRRLETSPLAGMEYQYFQRLLTLREALKALKSSVQVVGGVGERFLPITCRWGGWGVRDWTFSGVTFDEMELYVCMSVLIYGCVTSFVIIV